MGPTKSLTFSPGDLRVAMHPCMVYLATFFSYVDLRVDVGWDPQMTSFQPCFLKKGS